MKFIIFFLLLFSLNIFSETNISEGRLHQKVTYNGKSLGFKEGLILPFTESIKSFEADFKIEKLESHKLTADVMIELLYQDPQEKDNKNLKIIRLHIRDKGSSPKLKGTVIECHNEDCESYYKNEIINEPFNNHIDLKKEHKFKITHDGQSKNFLLYFDGIEQKINVINDFNPKHFKTARIAVSFKNHKGKNSNGVLSVFWDNIIINDKLYDNFDSNTLSNEKWTKFYKSYEALY